MSTNKENKILGMDQHDLNIFMKRYGIVEMKKIINHKIELFNASDKVKYYSL